ncbi:MAG: TonB-dependent receptor plug domain-containing protein [Flavobacteriales bacterium]|nr:TonB-dependent receptor plug domain-containing protein [Flavobacteriales bacterium]
MQKFVIAFIALCQVVGVAAQVRYTGQVLDERDIPLIAVNIVLGDDQAFGTTTDAEGRFTLNGLRGGAQRLRMSHVGHVMIDTLITGEQHTDQVFRMRLDVVMMRAAEITALRVGDAPFAKSIVSKEDIAKINTGVDLPYLLDLQPSVVTTSDAGTGIGYTGMRIRGTDATRTNITLNGVPFNDPESQGAFLVNLPDLASSAEDIEVQRGVGTSTNGPAAFGATVNLRSTTVKRDPWANIGFSGGSFNTQRYSVRAGTGLINEEFSLDVRLSSITSDGYIDRATADLKSYFLQGAWVGKERSLRFITFRGKEVTYQAWGGVPREVIDTNRTYNEYAYKNEVDNYEQAHYQLLFEEKLGRNTTFNLTGFRVDGKGYYENYKAEEESPGYFPGPVVLGNDTAFTNDFIIRRWLDNTLLGVNASLAHGFGKHKLIIGGSYNDYSGAHFGEVIWARFSGPYTNDHRYYDNDAHKMDANVYAKLNYAVSDHINAFGDLQLRTVNYDLLGFDDAQNNRIQNSTFAFFNPKGGVNWRVHEGGRIYGSVAVANREPNRDDFEETTPSSRPTSERLTDHELGYERRSAHFAAGINGYYMDYTDQLVLTGELNDVGAALRTNVPKSHRAGVELTWAAQITKRLCWKGNATFSRNRIKDFTEYVDNWDTGEQQAFKYTSAPIAFSPDLIAGSELGYRFWQATGKGSADLSLITKYVGQQFMDNSGSADRALDPYVVNDLRLNVGLMAVFGIPNIDINLTARNIFSELYESNSWSYSYILDGRRQELVGLYPQAPLNVLGGLTIRF